MHSWYDSFSHIILYTQVTVTRPPDLKFLFSHPAHFLSLGFGAGLSPKAPGTIGTLVAVPVYLVMARYLDHVTYAMVVLGIIALGFWICGITERALGSHDHGSIVWDEIAGFLVTMYLAPVTVWSIFAGFVLFRIFDIAKPFPVSWLDRELEGGFGTVMDDVVAGIFAWICLQAILFAVARM